MNEWVELDELGRLDEFGELDEFGKLVEFWVGWMGLIVYLHKFGDRGELDDVWSGAA